MKKCRKCQIEKSLEDFYRTKDNQTGRKAVCKTCEKIANYSWREKNRERLRKYNQEYVRLNPERRKRTLQDAWKRRVYNLEPEDYTLLDLNSGTCWICGGIGPKGLYVDHDHQTNIIRGLLCMQCNMAIGLLQENEGRFLAAVEYLRAHDMRGLL